MPRRAKLSYAAFACACAATAVSVGAFAIVSCVGSSNNTPPSGEDGSFAEEGGNPPGTDGGSGADGTSPTGTDGSVSDGGRTDASEPVADGSNDAPLGTLDAGFDAADAAPPCAPGSIAGFVVPGYVHAAAPQYPCQVSDVVALAESCAGDASTYSQCANYANEAQIFQQSPQCTACLLTPEVTLPLDAGTPTDASDDAAIPTYGAAVTTRVTVPNIAGCIEQNDPSDAGLSCAMAIQAAWRCEEYACNPSCPVYDDPSEAAYFACLQGAATGACATYAASAEACLTVEINADAGAAQTCLSMAQVSPANGESPFAGPAAQLYDIATFFCLN
ncbi:MAG: hypothetical protein ACLQVI_15125 [Polyangiaceae bacterium]